MAFWEIALRIHLVASGFALMVVAAAFASAFVNRRRR